MRQPANINLVDYENQDFYHIISINASYDISNKTFAGKIKNLEGEQKISLTITKGSSRQIDGITYNDLIIEIPRTAKSELELGTYNYDIIETDSISGLIKIFVIGKYELKNMIS